jgi:type IV secretion system protein VirB10
MSDQNKLLSDRIETVEEKRRGINLPMILGALALIGFIGAALWINLGGNDAGRRAGIIPEVNETPDPRSQGGALFGTVPTERMPEIQPQQDPRVAALEAEIAELRKLIAASQDQEPATDAEPTTEPPSPALDAEAVAALAKQQAALDALLKKMEDDRLAAERRQRELVARLHANRPITEPGQTAETAPNGDTEAQRLEAARKAEEERLAQPLTNSLGGGSAGAGAGTGANNSTGNDFLDAAASRSIQMARATQLKDVHRLVPQGRTIPAILETAISSDLPGELRARVSRDVWSADATTVLIPRGSTLVGEYSSDISLGQRRVLVAWNRVITPDQRSIMIGSRGVDALGRAGLTGNVQHHFGLKFEAAFFISIFSGISSFGNRTINDSDVASGTDGFANSGKDAFEEYLSIPPSIWVDQGEQFNVFVSRDLYL